MCELLNMNIFVVMVLVFIAGCMIDLCKYLFFALCWLLVDWPLEHVFNVLDANFAFSIFVLLLFVLLPVFWPQAAETLLNFLDLIAGLLYSSTFYRQLF